MRSIIVVLFVALLATAADAQAQTPAQDDAALAQLRASMSASAHASLSTLVRDARQRGLPTEPLIAKAQEGAAKKMAGERIVVAVSATADRLARAQLLLRGRGSAEATPADITAVAVALQRGVPEDAIARLTGDTRGRATIALSSNALADLLGHGVPLAIGVEVLGAWREKGADPEKLKEIPAAIERLVRQGVVPSRAGAAIAAGIRIGRAPASITPLDVPRILRGG